MRVIWLFYCICGMRLLPDFGSDDHALFLMADYVPVGAIVKTNASMF